MKKLILFAAAIMISFSAMAQKHEVYCELLGVGRIFSTKVTVSVDFGQSQFQNNTICDSVTGKRIIFNSMVDAMNFFGKLGWKLKQAYAASVGKQNVYHWLMCKEVYNDAEITQGFRIKAEVNRSKREIRKQEQIENGTYYEQQDDVPYRAQ